MKGIAASILAFLCCGLSLAGQEDGKRIALVIGNDNYPTRPLQNAVNDARAMQKALADAGFRVIMRENAGKIAMEEGVGDFLSQIGPGDTALLYYAGHAVQMEGENVLIPADFVSSKTVIDAKFKSLSLTPVFAELKRSRAKTIIVVLDACRTNPVAESYALKAGLANPSDAGKNTYLAFSTSPGMIAGDNPNGRNSWFTEALAKAIAQPGITLDEVFTRVRLQVEVATGGKQTPWSITSLTSKFYFYPTKDGAGEKDATLLSQWLQEARRQEQHGNWPEAGEMYSRILRQKAGGPEETVAQARLPYVEARIEQEKRFAAGEWDRAMAAAEKSLELDGFAMDAALELASGALVSGDLKRAAAALGRVRQRGATQHVERASKMLEKLAASEPSAAEALRQDLAQAPPLRELFPDKEFGVPDWDAARRWFRQALADVDYGTLTKQLQPPPAPAAPANTGTVEPAGATFEESASEVRLGLHVVVKPVISGRDLISEDTGDLTIRSIRRELTLFLDGKPLSKQLPFTMSLPAGEYELHMMDASKKLSERRVRVKANAVTEVDLQ